MKLVTHLILLSFPLGLLMGCAAPDADRSVGQINEAVAEVPVHHCMYRNVFSGQTECKEYRGEAWSYQSAEEDCATGMVGEDFQFFAEEACSLADYLGTCSVDENDALDYVLFVGGNDPARCTPGELACINFLGGEFSPSRYCVDDPEAGDHTVFIWPTEACVEPLDGEPQGNGPDGTVCTKNIISGCTEEGRDFRDYGSCEVVETNRPYYSLPGNPPGSSDDTRRDDPVYMQELQWVRSQVESCACICCHSEASPNGPAKWGVDSDDLWVDMMSDDAIGMFAGFIDSSALGHYPAEENNGFNRTESGLPTTDVDRMLKFFLEEFERRGLDEEEMSEKPPIGGPLIDQMTHSLEACPEGDGIDADGRIWWQSNDKPARYVYILEEGSGNPGVPPNFDTPEGTLWRLDVPHDGVPVRGGFHYGTVPDGRLQRVPASDLPAPTLESGRRYHLYVLYDVAVPLTRCVFEHP